MLIIKDLIQNYHLQDALSAVIVCCLSGLVTWVWSGRHPLLHFFHIRVPIESSYPISFVGEKKRGWYYLSRSINTWKIRYWNDQVHVVPWKEGPRSVEREKIVLRGLFFQNPTASLYVSGKWGGWGGLSGASAPATPATSPTLAKFLRAHPFQLRRPGRPAKGSGFLARKQKSGGCDLAAGMWTGVWSRTSAVKSWRGNRWDINVPFGLKCYEM